jgi:hypothetical protein
MTKEKEGKSPIIILTGNHPKEHPKDCGDFKPWLDGTLTGDWRYCRLSLLCCQKHPNEAGILIGCISHHDFMTDPEDPDSVLYAPFCTGCLPKEEQEDEKRLFQKNRIIPAGKE